MMELRMTSPTFHADRPTDLRRAQLGHRLAYIVWLTQYVDVYRCQMDRAALNELPNYMGLWMTGGLGTDLENLNQNPAPLYAQQFTRWERIRKIRKPLIAAVSGFALGGGCELAMLCDLIVAAETARFGQPEIRDQRCHHARSGRRAVPHARSARRVPWTPS